VENLVKMFRQAAKETLEIKMGKVKKNGMIIHLG
jgi:hypothetical protein